FVDAGEWYGVRAALDGADFSRPVECPSGDAGSAVLRRLGVTAARADVGEATVLSRRRHRVQPVSGLLADGRDEALAVAAPDEVADVVAVDVDRDDPPRLTILDLQLPLVGLVAVARLRSPRQVAAVG